MIPRCFLAAMLCLAAARPLAAAAAMPAAVRKVTVVVDAILDKPARHGVDKLEAALRDKGIAVSEDPAQVASSDAVVVMGVASARGPAATLLAALRVTAPAGAESLVIRRAADFQGKPAMLLAGGDGVGLMYAALDTADRVAWAAAGANPFQLVKDAAEQPLLRERGVVAFTMQQAYFESHLHDPKYWERYFDMFAADRINQFVLTFGYETAGYMAPLYPYFFDVDGFPNVKVNGLTAEQQKLNRDSLLTLFRLAAERGVRVKIGIWDHIATRAAGRGRAGARAGAEPPAPPAGLVQGLDGTNLVPYTVAALKKFYETFPDVSQTQFRMHNESGLQAAEIEPFWEAVWSFFQSSQPDREIEMRAKGLERTTIKDAQAKGLKISLDTKIWMEHMGLPYHPTLINQQNRAEARHSYADLLEYPQTYKMDWTLWNGGTQRLLLWGDPDYARRLAREARLYDGQTFAVTEMEATKMLGEPQTAPPRDFLNAKYKYTDYEFERYWDFYRVWGRLSYNPDSSPEVWQQEFVRRFGAEAAPHVEKALELSSAVLPHVVATSFRYQGFPTTIGWPEMDHQGSLPTWAASAEVTDVAQFLNIRDEASSILNGTDTALRRPEEISHWFSRASDQILAEVAAAEAAAKGAQSNEFKSSLADARVLAAMARYHAARQLGGVSYNLYKQAGDLTAFDEAIAFERKAVQAWSDLVDSAGDFYSENMAFGTNGRKFPRHWKDELAALQTEFATLTAERAAATGKPDAKPVRVRAFDPGVKPPVVALQPPPVAAVRGQDLPVTARVAAPAGVKSISLRYRQVNQHDNYQTVPMALDARTGLYGAVIPGSFITPTYDVMYYVEIIDQKGTGRIYPDVEVETPYVVVPVKR